MISNIQRIKDEFSKNNYIEGEELRKAVNEVSNTLWENIQGNEKADYSNIALVHHFLLREYQEILQREVCYKNEYLIKNTLNLKEHEKEYTDGALSSRIYIFNDEEYTYYFLGDIHSDYFIVERILDNIDFYNRVVKKEKIRIVFLGDYVDRGKNHLRTLEKILLLKYIFPGNIYHLQGNHDGGTLKEDEVKLCVGKPKEDKDEDYFLLYVDKLSKENETFPRTLIKEYLKLFYNMAAMVMIINKERTYLCVHGGIPRPIRGEIPNFHYFKNLKDLSSMEILDRLGDTIIHNMLWSDPIRGDEELDEVHRRFNFTQEEFEVFSQRVGIDYLIRGHEAHESGCEVYFQGRLYSVFSSGKILQDGNNINPETAYVEVTPKIINLKNDKLSIITIN